MDWLIEHWDELSIAFAAVLTLVSAIVRVTPTKKDDEFLAKFLGFLSFLRPKAGWKVPLTPMPKDHVCDDDCEHD